MTLQEFIEKTKTDEALKAKVDAAVMEKVILPMAQAAGVELSEEELEAISGGRLYGNPSPSLSEVTFRKQFEDMLNQTK